MYLNDTLGVDSFSGSRLSSDKHRLVLSLSQHVIVSVVRNGENMRRHLRLSLSLVTSDDVIIVYGEPLNKYNSFII